MDQDVLQIAQVCYEANRAYCKTIGDDSFGDWIDAPDWQKQTNMAGVRFQAHSYLTTGQPPSVAASHESWMDMKRAEGWTYGPVKDAEKKTHPCFLPYSKLPPEQRMKDYIFGSICSAFFLGPVAKRKETLSTT